MAFLSAASEFACVWQDGRGGAGDIWGQRLHSLCGPHLPQEPANHPPGMGGETGTGHGPPGATPDGVVESGAGGSVLANSGQFVYTLPVAQIPGICPPFVFTIDYRSANGALGDLGAGWTHSYEGAIETTATPGGSDAIFWGPTGRNDLYVFSGGAYQTPLGFYDRLEYDAPNDAFVRSGRHGSVETYGHRDGNRYRLTRIRDRNQNETTLAYDAGHKLASVTDGRGNVVTFQQSPQGRIDSFSDWTGRTWRFERDANQDLTAVVTPSTTEFPAGKRMTFEYLSGQNEAWMNHNLVAIRDYAGVEFLRNVYQASTDRVVSQQFGSTGQVYGFQYLPGQSIETDRRGFTTTYFLDAQGNAVQVIDQDGHTWHKAYNQHMELVGMTLPRGNAYAAVYDDQSADRRAQGNLLEARWTDGALGGDPDRVFAWTYEPHFNLVKTVRNPRGFVWTNVFDYEQGGPDRGNVVELHQPVVTLGQPGPQAVVDTFTWNAKGLISSHTDGEGNRETWTYYGPPDIRKRPVNPVWNPVGNCVSVRQTPPPTG